MCPYILEPPASGRLLSARVANRSLITETRRLTSPRNNWVRFCMTSRGSPTRSIIRNHPSHQNWLRFVKEAQPLNQGASKSALSRHLARLPDAIHHPEPPISPRLASFRRKGSTLNQGVRLSRRSRVTSRGTPTRPVTRKPPISPGLASFRKKSSNLIKECVKVGALASPREAPRRGPSSGASHPTRIGFVS